MQPLLPLNIENPRLVFNQCALEYSAWRWRDIVLSWKFNVYNNRQWNLPLAGIDSAHMSTMVLMNCYRPYRPWNHLNWHRLVRVSLWAKQDWQCHQKKNNLSSYMTTTMCRWFSVYWRISKPFGRILFFLHLHTLSNCTIAPFNWLYCSN